MSNTPVPTLRLAAAALALACLATTAAAGKIVVDAQGGPGSQFLDIPPAIAAAQPGDLILVRVGHYSAFSLDKGLAILGEGDPLTFNGSAHVPSASVDGVPAGSAAVLVNLRIDVFAVQDTQAAVVLDGVANYREATVRNARDVRFHAMAGGMGELDVVGSRVEVVGCTLYGYGGADGQSGNRLWPAEPGGPALRLGGFNQPRARAHLAETTCLGGSGGDWSQAGDGGAGVVVDNDSELVFAGAGVGLIRGGDGGWGDDCSFDGDGGDGLVNAGSRVQRSGETLAGGLAPPGQGFGCFAVDGVPHSYHPDANSLDQKLAAWDPTLTFTGTPAPGQTLDVRLTGRDGSSALVWFGDQPVVRPDAATHVELLVAAPRRNVAFAGPIVTGNQLTFPFTVPANAQQGDLVFLQGLIVLPSGQLRRTNSVPVFVR